MSLSLPPSESFFFSMALFGMVMHWLELDILETMVSKSGHDKWARLLSTPSDPEDVLLGRIRNSGDKDVLEIPDETD